MPTEQSVRLADELPDAELVVIPDCGHVPHEECPQPFLQAVTDFLNQLAYSPPDGFWNTNVTNERITRI